MSLLILDNLKKTYGDGTQAVRGIDLEVERGEFIVLLGPSGCGKTTTLRMVAGLEQTSSGMIRVQGKDVTRLRPSQRDVGMVFQFYALYPHLSVRDNIGFPLRAAGVSPKERQRRVKSVAERMGLSPMLDSFPKQLSGGDQQKVSLARAIVRRPTLYLMDEPLGTLDADQRLLMRDVIRAEQSESQVTTLYVTHDQEEAMSLADRIVVMEGGLIRQVGTPLEIYDHPATKFVAEFVGSPEMNFISGVLQPSDAPSPQASETTSEASCEASSQTNGHPAKACFVSDRGQLRLAVEHPRARGRVTLGIRCEHVHEDPAGPLEARVLIEEYLGSENHVHLETDVGRIVMRAHGRRRRERGSELRLRLDPERVCLFDASADESSAGTEARARGESTAPAANQAGASFLSLRGVSKRLGRTQALADLDLEVQADELLVVLGPTGAGKTTLLRTIAGLERPDSGSITMAGRDVTALDPAARDVALVFQNFSLYPRWSVRQNLAFPLRAPGRSVAETEIQRRVEWAAELLKITRLLDREASRLSGGEMQRVAIGRAIVRRPRLFLLDEPLTNLDAKLREALRVELVELRRELAAPMVYVTHDQAEALSMADRIVVLSQGRELQTGKPREIYERPCSPIVALQLGQPAINLIAVRRQDGFWVAADGTQVMPAEVGGSDERLLGIRPEDITPDPSDVGGTHAQGSEAIVQLAASSGATTTLLCQWAGSQIHIVVPGRATLRAGERIRPRLDLKHACLFELDSAQSTQPGPSISPVLAAKPAPHPSTFSRGDVP